MSKKYLISLHWFIRFLLIVGILTAIWFFVSEVAPRILPEKYVRNTNRWGIIFRNERWSGEVHVKGDIWAMPGTTVTIEPGTKVLVAESHDKFNLNLAPWYWKSGLNTGEGKFGVRNGELFWDERQKIHLDFGKLLAIGTKEQPIIIRPDINREASPYDFNGITIHQGVLSNVSISNYRKLAIKGAVNIQDSVLKNSADCSICVEYSNPSVFNNTFDSTIRQYIFIVGGNPQITNNTFLSSPKGKGIVVDPQISGVPIISNNNFEIGPIALEFLSGSEEKGGTVSYNIFSGNSMIQIPCDSRVQITQNDIKGLVSLASSGNCVGVMTLGPNYWQSPDIKGILREKIIGKEASFKVLLPQVLTNPPVGVGPR